MRPRLLHEHVAAGIERRQGGGTKGRMDGGHNGHLGPRTVQSRLDRVRDPDARPGAGQGGGQRLGPAKVEIDEGDHLGVGRERLQALAADEPAADHRHPGHVRTSCLVRIHGLSAR